jgi:hypothetical protein
MNYPQLVGPFMAWGCPHKPTRNKRWIRSWPEHFGQLCLRWGGSWKGEFHGTPKWPWVSIWFNTKSFMVTWTILGYPHDFGNLHISRSPWENHLFKISLWYIHLLGAANPSFLARRNSWMYWDVKNSYWVFLQSGWITNHGVLIRSASNFAWFGAGVPLSKHRLWGWWQGLWEVVNSP